jgi:hypothetical protein
VTDIASIRKELKGGDVWFDPIYQYDETSSANDLRWNHYEIES